MDVEHSSGGSMEVSRKQRRLYILSWVGAALFLALISPLWGFGTAPAALLLFLLVVAVLSVQGIGMSRTLGGKIVVVPGTLMATMLLSQVMIAIVWTFMSAFPPPRPMFHNHYATQRRGVLPVWRRPYPGHDLYRNRVWADYEDNVVLVIAANNLETKQYQIRRMDVDSTTLGLYGSDDNDLLTIPRTTDQMIIVLPTGMVGQFELDKGLAEKFYTERFDYAPAQSLLREAIGLLSEEEQTRCEAFLVGHRELLIEVDDGGE